MSFSAGSSSEIPFKVGSIIADPSGNVSYTLKSVIGSGSYAVVYLAQNNRTRAVQAIKCLSKISLDEDQLEMQRLELRLHQRVSNHKSVVAIDRAFETADWRFLVMEFADGQDLYEWITSDSLNRVHPTKDTRANQVKRFTLYKSIFQQVLDAVAHVHAQGVYHRDIKPENIIITRQHYRIKLTDFGLATECDRSDEFECGSRPYMSRENRSTQRTFYSSSKSDIWALGIIFLNVFYGVTPWSEPDVASSQSFAAFVRDGVRFLVDRVNCPEEVASFLHRRVFCHEMVRCSVSEFAEWTSSLDNIYLSSFTAPSAVEVAPLPYRPSFDSTPLSEDDWYLSEEEETAESSNDFDLFSTPAPQAIPIQQAAASPSRPSHLLVPSMAVRFTMPFNWADEDDENDDEPLSFSIGSSTSTLFSPTLPSVSHVAAPSAITRPIPVAAPTSTTSTATASPTFVSSSYARYCSWADDDDDELEDLSFDDAFLSSTAASAMPINQKQLPISMPSQNKLAKGGANSAHSAYLSAKLSALSLHSTSACSPPTGIFMMDGF